jgi:uncharacterized protein (TIGR02145 family)
MKELVLFNCNSILTIKYPEVRGSKMGFTFRFVFLIILTIFVTCCKKDQPASQNSYFDLLTSAVWGDDNICGYISSPDVYTRIFNKGGTYIEYYRMYPVRYNGTWSLTDSETLVINGDQYKILTLDEDLLRIQGKLCASTFLAQRQIKALTVGVTSLSATSARLHAFVRTCESINVSFEYGPSTAYGAVVAPGISSLTGPSNNIISVTLESLNPSTLYHYRIKATNTGGTVYGQDLTFRTFDAATISDADNNVYNTITIGSQTWITENLKTTKFNDGSAIAQVADNKTWSEMSTAGYCWYNNDEPTYKESYGALYNWYAVNTGNLCPAGWHVPGEKEWTQLIQYLGQHAGSKLTEGRFDMSDPLSCIIADSFEPANESGFSGLCSGWRSYEADFYSSYCNFWSSTEENSLNAIQVEISNDFELVESLDKNTGLNVRCIKN